MKNSTKKKNKCVPKWMLNPEYDKATHAIWFIGWESWEDFSKREFGRVIPRELV